MMLAGFVWMSIPLLVVLAACMAIPIAATAPALPFALSCSVPAAVNVQELHGSPRPRR